MILASNSQRRKEILSDMGFKFKVFPAEIDEMSDKTDIAEKVMDIAYKKALNIAEKYEKEYVLSADTIVEIDGKILGKPSSREEVSKYLKMLSGRTHRVITAFSFVNIEKQIYIKDFSLNEVEFYNINDEQIEWYIESKEPFDKAGAYGIQGLGRIFVKRISGDFYSIMGFPIAKFISVLGTLGYRIDEIDKI